MKEIASIAALANRFSALPGVGRKTALRYAYAVIDMTEDEVDSRPISDFILRSSGVRLSIGESVPCST